MQTIFDGGAKKAASDLALAQEQEQIADYRKTVFNAFSNVETAQGLKTAQAAVYDLMDDQRARMIRGLTCVVATLLFAPATVIYMLARRERGERMFTRTETVVALVITAIGAYAFWARLTGRLVP